MRTILDILFGCWHKRHTFPIQTTFDTYVCCLECGKEFAYDWAAMKVTGVRVIPVETFHQREWQADAEETVEMLASSKFDESFLKAMRISVQ